MMKARMSVKGGAESRATYECVTDTREGIEMSYTKPGEADGGHLRFYGPGVLTDFCGRAVRPTCR